MKLFHKDTKVAALKRSPLFASLSNKELEELAQTSEDMEVDAGAVLARQGESGREFFVVLEGEVDITRDGKPVSPHAHGAHAAAFLRAHRPGLSQPARAEPRGGAQGAAGDGEAAGGDGRAGRQHRALNSEPMRLEENIGVAVGVAVGIGFLVWFLLASFVSASIGGGMIPAAG